MYIIYIIYNIYHIYILYIIYVYIWYSREETFTLIYFPPKASSVKLNILTRYILLFTFNFQEL